MSSTSELNADVLIFFKLDIQLPALKSIFSSVENFSDLVGQRRPAQIAPGLTIGPSSLAISKFKNTKIKYTGDRHLLRQSGPLSELVELSEILPSLFEKQSYSLEEIIRFCELGVHFSPLMGKGVVDWIRENVKVNLEGLSKVCNEELKPFAFWASNSDTALTDNWLNFIFHPDVNSPHNRLLWRMTKRTKTHSELTEFLKRTNAIVEELGRMFGAQ